MRTLLLAPLLVLVLSACGEAPPPAPAPDVDRALTEIEARIDALEARLDAREAAAPEEGAAGPVAPGSGEELTAEQMARILEQARRARALAERMRRASEPEVPDLSGGVPGAGLWCGTGARQPGLLPDMGDDWHGPDAQGVYVRYEGETRVRRVSLPAGRPAFGDEEPARYGMSVGVVFHQSEPGESREAFVARMQALKAKLAAEAAAADEKK